MRAKINSGADFRNANITFADYFERWVSIYKTNGVAKHTHDMYQLTALGTNAATESMTTISIAPDSTNLLAISNPSSPPPGNNFQEW